MRKTSCNQRLGTHLWFTLNFPTTDCKVEIRWIKEYKELLEQQIEKLKKVLLALNENFDMENEIADEYSFLSIVKQKLEAFAKI